MGSKELISTGLHSIQEPQNFCAPKEYIRPSPEQERKGTFERLKSFHSKFDCWLSQKLTFDFCLTKTSDHLSIRIKLILQFFLIVPLLQKLHLFLTHRQLGLNPSFGINRFHSELNRKLNSCVNSNLNRCLLEMINLT